MPNPTLQRRMRAALAAATLAAATTLLAPAVAQTAAPSSPAKKELVNKIIQLQGPGIDAMSRQLVEQPAMQMLQQASMALQQRVPADKREAVAREIQADARKYSDETYPMVRERAVRLAPQVIGPILEREFTEDELRQIISILESPVNRKYLQLGNEMQRALGEKLVAESRPQVEPKVRALDQTIAKRLGIVPEGGGAPATGAAPAAGAGPAANTPKK